VSSLRYQSDSVAADTATTGSIASNRSNTRFYLNVDDMGSLSGTVTSGGNALEDVLITIEDTVYHTTTSATGEYSFSHVPVGDYTLTAHKVGYEDVSQTFSIVEDENTVVDLSMTPSASVSVTGTVVGSDNPTVGLSDAIISLSGVLDYSATTNASGQFTVQNVLSGNTYNYSIFRPGYQNLTGSITVGATNYDMGTVTLEELTLPPSAVTATLNDEETQVDLIWSSPGMPGNYYFFDFENDDGDWEATATWDPIGDWEYTDSYDIADWAPIYTGTNVNPPQQAYSGTGLWGTVITTNHANSGGFNYLTKTFDLSGFSNTQMNFWSWENLFGNFDYAQISVNGTVVWGPSWDYQGTVWQERIIDLSDFDGMSDVEIRLEMYATTTVNYAGWYVDDIYIGPADQAVRTSPPSVIPGDFRGLTEIQAAELAESRAQATPQRAAQSLRQPPRSSSRLPIGYQVWRLQAGQENSPGSWVSLTPSTITDTTFVDPSWESFGNGLYKWAVRTVYTNDVLSNPGFSNTIRKEPNDMSALTISGNITPSVGAPTNYTIRVKNTGTAAQAAGAYDVKIMSGTTELASVPGPAIQIDQEINVQVPWSPTQTGNVTIYGMVDLPDDSNDTNDTTDTMTVMVMPSGQFAYTVGEGNELARRPMDMYYKNSLFQMILYHDELDSFFGLVTGIQFYNNFVSDLPNMPTKIWLGTTTATDLTDGMIPTTDGSTLVFDATVNFPSGENVIPIIFDVPYEYLNGENLLVTVNRPMDTQYYNSQDRFRCQTLPQSRARNFYSDSTTYLPESPPTTGTADGQFPMTSILGIPGGVAHLSGTVTNPSGDPLDEVLVQFEDSGYQAITNADGEYEIPYILPDSYTIVFSRYGYITQSQDLTLEEDDEIVLDLTMQPMPMVSVSGTILASDTSDGIMGAVIQLMGYANYTAITDADGEFLFPAVYANNSYEYIISGNGYTSTTGIIDVGATNYEMGDMILDEIAYAPHSVTAQLNDSFSAVNITWEEPDPTALEILESFENTNFPPQDWDQIITNTGPANTLGVFPTFKRVGAIEIAGEANAVPTHGSYQAGLWWSYEHQDEWLITPTFNCPPDAYMRFDSYVFLGSTNGDHYYVKVSLDSGNTWTSLWDASAETGGQIAYNQPLVVDLAAYGGQQITLAFNAVDPPSNDGLWYTWFIDNIYIGNALTMVSFDGPAQAQHRARRSSNQAAADQLRRDGSRSRADHHSQNQRTVTEETRGLIGYEVYRLVSGQENNEGSWVLLTDEIITDLSFEDDGWESLANATYRWGVKAIYTADVASPAAMSNPLVKDSVTGNIVGFVRRNNGQGIANATVSAGENYTATTNSAGAYSLNLPIGTYSVTASATSFASVTIEDVLVSPNQNTTLNFTLEPSSNEDEVIPVTVTALHGNYPNPFNPETTISYDIKDPTNVRLDIYNVRGQLVRTLVNEQQSSARYRVVFDAKDRNGSPLSSGIYFYRLRAGDYIQTRKMMLME
jgi:hypothetical protein